MDPAQLAAANELLQVLGKHGGLVGTLVGLLFISQTVAIVFLAKWGIRLSTLLHKVQEDRVEDAKEVRQELLDQDRLHSQVQREVSGAISSLRDVVLLKREDR